MESKLPKKYIYSDKPREMTPLSTPKSNKLTLSSPLPRLNIARSISKELDAAKKPPFAKSPLGIALRKIGIRVEL